MYGRTETIEELLAVSVTQLKRLGFIQPNAYKYGVLDWKQGGRVVARAGLAVDTRGTIATVRFLYDYNGTPLDYTTPLRFTPSNLNRGGFYYFVCPVTGRSCRKLYIVGGRFVSRFAFRALYEKQAKSRNERGGLFGFIDAATKYEDLTNAPRRKWFYRGKPTPYGRKVERAGEKARRIGRDLELTGTPERRRRNVPAGQIADFGAFWE